MVGDPSVVSGMVLFTSGLPLWMPVRSVLLLKKICQAPFGFAANVLPVFLF